MKHNYTITTPNAQLVIEADSRGEAVKKYLKQSGMPGEFFKRHCSCKICTYSVRNAPTVSPDEIRGVGKWIKNYDRVKWWYECSCCHEKPLISRFGDTEILSTYCPNCGAKMEVSDDA